MAGGLTEALRSTCFILRPSVLTQGLTLPKDLPVKTLATETELAAFGKEGFGGASRVVLILADHDFIPTINLLREKVMADSSCHLGVVVVSKVPANLLKERHAFPELVDVVLDTALGEHPEFHLMRAVVGSPGTELEFAL